MAVVVCRRSIIKIHMQMQPPRVVWKLRILMMLHRQWLMTNCYFYPHPNISLSFNRHSSLLWSQWGGYFLHDFVCIHRHNGLWLLSTVCLVLSYKHIYVYILSDIHMQICDYSREKICVLWNVENGIFSVCFWSICTEVCILSKWERESFIIKKKIKKKANLFYRMKHFFV